MKNISLGGPTLLRAGVDRLRSDRIALADGQLG
jgi:hypothetical protein